MNRSDKNLIKTLKNIATSSLTNIKFRKIDNAWWYWAMNAEGKQIFCIKRTCNVSSGHPVFDYVVKYQGAKTTDKNIGAKIFPLMEFEYNRNWLNTKRKNLKVYGN